MLEKKAVPLSSVACNVVKNKKNARIEEQDFFINFIQFERG